MTTGPHQQVFPRNRNLHKRRRLFLFALGPASYLAFLVLGWLPLLAETIYRNLLAPILAGVLSTITGFIPFAVGELLVLALLVRYMVSGTIALVAVSRSLRQTRNAVSAAVLRLAQDSGVVVCLFYVLWGFNYALSPLPERLNWPALGDVSVDELLQLAAETGRATNSAYYDLHGVADAGTPTALPTDLDSLEEALHEGWRNARERLEMPPNANRFGRAKTPLFTGLYEWLGIAGFYFPFTGEANVRAGIPAIDYPRILAHEKTHQRGVARESEANFWGYLSAANSRDPLARYSAYRLANRQMLSELARLDVEAARHLTRNRLPGVQRDIDDAHEYWLRFQGRGTSIGNSVNNAFLRSNRVEGGVRSYSMSAFLFLAYARANGGSLVPRPVSGETPDR
jgi:hypothetical protein